MSFKIINNYKNALQNKVVFLNKTNFKYKIGYF